MHKYICKIIHVTRYLFKNWLLLLKKKTITNYAYLILFLHPGIDIQYNKT